MKLNAFHIKDRMHPLEMLDVGLIGQAWADRLPPEHARRLQRLIDNPKASPTALAEPVSRGLTVTARCPANHSSFLRLDYSGSGSADRSKSIRSSKSVSGLKSNQDKTGSFSLSGSENQK